MPRWSQLVKLARPPATSEGTSSNVVKAGTASAAASSAHSKADAATDEEHRQPLTASQQPRKQEQHEELLQGLEDPSSAMAAKDVPVGSANPAAAGSAGAQPSLGLGLGPAASHSSVVQNTADHCEEASQPPQPRKRERPRWDAMLVGRHSTLPAAASAPGTVASAAATAGQTRVSPTTEDAVSELPPTSAPIPPQSELDVRNDTAAKPTGPLPARPKRLAVPSSLLQSLLSAPRPNQSGEMETTQASTAAAAAAAAAPAPASAAVDSKTDAAKDVGAEKAAAASATEPEPELSTQLVKDEVTVATTARELSDGTADVSEEESEADNSKQDHDVDFAAAAPAPTAAAIQDVQETAVPETNNGDDDEDDDDDDVEDLEGLELMQAAEEELRLYRHDMAAVLAKEAEECLRQPRAKERVQRTAVLALVADDRPHQALASTISLQPATLAKAECELALGRARPALLTAEAALKRVLQENQKPRKFVDTTEDDDSHAQALELVARAGLKLRTVAGSRRAIEAAEEMVALRHKQTAAAGAQPPSSWSCSAVAKEMTALVFLASLHRERHELELSAAICSSVFEVPSPPIPDGVILSHKTKLMLKKEEGLAEAQALTELSTITRLLAEAGQEDAEVAISHAQDAVELSRRLGDRKQECLARCALAEAYHSDTLLSLALEAAQAAVVLARELPVRALQRDCLQLVSKLLLPAKACHFLNLELEIARKREDLWLEREVLYKLAVLRAYDEPAKAKQIADEALRASQGDPHAQAKAQRTAAEMHFVLGDTSQALLALDRAQSLFLQAGNVAAAAEALKSKATTYEDDEDFTGALAAAKARVRAFSKAGWSEEEALALVNLATVTAKCSPIGEALGIISKALRLCEAIHFAAGEAEASLAVASMQLHYSSNIEEAWRCAEKARRLFEKLGEPSGEAKACKLSGLASSRIHDPQRISRAVDAVSAALKRSLAVGDRRGEAECLQVLADLHYSLVVDEMDMGCRPPGNKLEESLNIFMLAAAAWDGLRERSLQANCMIQLSTLYMADEDGDAAVQAAKEAKELASKLDDVAPEAAALLALAESHAFRGDWQEAQDAAEEAKSAYEDMQDHDGIGEAEDLLRKATRKLRSKAKPTPRTRSADRPRMSNGASLWKSVMESMQRARFEEAERSEQRLKELLPWREDETAAQMANAEGESTVRGNEDVQMEATSQRRAEGSADADLQSNSGKPPTGECLANGDEEKLLTLEGGAFDSCSPEAHDPAGASTGDLPEDQHNEVVELDLALGQENIKLDSKDDGAHSNLEGEEQDEDAIVLSRIINAAVHISTTGNINSGKHEAREGDQAERTNVKERDEEEEEEEEEDEEEEEEEEEEDTKQLGDDTITVVEGSDPVETSGKACSSSSMPDGTGPEPRHDTARDHFGVSPLAGVSQRGDTWRPAHTERRWKSNRGSQDNEAIEANRPEELPAQQGIHPGHRGSGPLRPPGQWHVPPADTPSPAVSTQREAKQMAKSGKQIKTEDEILEEHPDSRGQQHSFHNPTIGGSSSSSFSSSTSAAASAAAAAAPSSVPGHRPPTTSTRGFSSFSSFAASRQHRGGGGGGGEEGDGGGGCGSAGHAEQQESHDARQQDKKRDLERRGSDDSIGSRSGTSGSEGGGGREERRRRSSGGRMTCESPDIPVVDLRESPIPQKDDVGTTWREDEDIEEVYREDFPRSLDDMLEPDFKQPWFGDVMNIEAQYLNDDGNYEAVTVQFADEAGNGVFRVPSGRGPIEFFHIDGDEDDELEWIEDDDDDELEYRGVHVEDEVSSCDSEELEIQYFPDVVRAM